jgi:hypothetical protein
MPQFHAADIQVPTFPGPILPDNNPPSAQAIRALAHPFAVWNLYRVLHDNIHFEHMTYGYFNAVLNTTADTPRLPGDSSPISLLISASTTED